MEITRLNRNGAGLSEEESMQLDVFCYGIGHMYEKWIKGKYELDAATAANMLFQIMPPTLRDYRFPKKRQ